MADFHVFEKVLWGGGGWVWNPAEGGMFNDICDGTRDKAET